MYQVSWKKSSKKIKNLFLALFSTSDMHMEMSLYNAKEQHFKWLIDCSDITVFSKWTYLMEHMLYSPTKKSPPLCIIYCQIWWRVDVYCNSDLDRLPFLWALISCVAHKPVKDERWIVLSSYICYPLIFSLGTVGKSCHWNYISS